MDKKIVTVIKTQTISIRKFRAYSFNKQKKQKFQQSKTSQNKHLSSLVLEIEANTASNSDKFNWNATAVCTLLRKSYSNIV